MNPDARERSAVTFRIRHPHVVNSEKNLVGDRGKKRSINLPFEKMIYRNVQPLHDDDHRILKKMTSTALVM